MQVSPLTVVAFECIQPNAALKLGPLDEVHSRHRIELATNPTLAAILQEILNGPNVGTPKKPVTGRGEEQFLNMFSTLYP